MFAAVFRIPKRGMLSGERPTSRIGKSVGCFLARALAAIDLIADGHPEFLVGVRIARGDVLGETRKCLLCLGNPLGKLRTEYTLFHPYLFDDDGDEGTKATSKSAPRRCHLFPNGPWFVVILLPSRSIGSLSSISRTSAKSFDPE